MKKYSGIVSFIMFFTVFSFLFSCKHDSDKPDHPQEKDETYLITFKVEGRGDIIAIVEGQNITSPTNLKKGTKISLTSSPHPNFKVKNWENVTTKSQDLTTAELIVDKNTDVILKCIPKEIEKFYLPYLRFFDSMDEVEAFEIARGNTFVGKDETFDYIGFSSTSTAMPMVMYTVGRASQINMTADILQSDEFINFMKDNGFETDKTIANGMMMFQVKNEKLKTVASAFSVIDKVAAGNYPVECVCFTMKPPVLGSLNLPLIDWEANINKIKTFEQNRQFKELTTRIDDKGRKEVVFGKRIETSEYDIIDVVKYLFGKGSEKLIKITYQLHPAHFVLEPQGDAFSTYKAFNELLTKKMEYTKRKATIPANGPKKDVYESKDKSHKFTLEQWKVKIEGKNRQMAGIAIVPFAGDDIIE